MGTTTPATSAFGRRQRRECRRSGTALGGATLGLTGALLLAGASAWAQQFTFTTVALTGQHAPGTAAGRQLPLIAPPFA